MKAPSASLVRTPQGYGAVVPPFTAWPLNADNRVRYDLAALYPTIQGEGLNAGRAMTIVRLQGCPVGCIWCDTPESWDPSRPQLAQQRGDAIAQTVDNHGLGWALITGGEPTWHDLTCLTVMCRRLGIKTALETSGTMPISGEWDWVTLSPKPRGALPLLPVWISIASELKWVVGSVRDLERLRAFLTEYDRPDLPVLIQPISAKPHTTRLCVEAVMDEPRYRLSLQTHKILDIA